jgi:hypothetical protein
MNRKTLLAGVATLLIAGTGTFALAQTASTPATTPSAATQPGAKPGMPMHGKFMQHGSRAGFMHHRGMRGHGSGPAGAVISDLRHIERLYMETGKSRELPALYNDVLGRTQDARVRNYVYARLARAQLRPSDTSAAIGTLRKSLDENLTRLSQRQADKKG